MPSLLDSPAPYTHLSLPLSVFEISVASIPHIVNCLTISMEMLQTTIPEGGNKELDSVEG